LARLTIRNTFGEDTNGILTEQQPEVYSVFRQEKVMVAGNPIQADLDSAAASQVVVSVDPDGKVLLGLRTLEAKVHGFDGLSTLEVL
jgi:hypothetical protein